MKVKVLIAKGFEEIEAITLIDLLRRVRYDLKTVSTMGTKEVQGAHQIPIITDSLLEEENFNDTDLLILPGGGEGVRNLQANNKVIEIVKNINENKKFIGAICAAPKILDKAGIIKNRNITCYPSCENDIIGRK